MHEWMTAARDRWAGAVGDDAASYDLTDDDVRVRYLVQASPTGSERMSASSKRKSDILQNG